jgi:hypothetical protein
VLIVRQRQQTSRPWTGSFLGMQERMGRTPVQAAGPTPMLAVARAAALAIACR